MEAIQTNSGMIKLISYTQSGKSNVQYYATPQQLVDAVIAEKNEYYRSHPLERHKPLIDLLVKVIMSYLSAQ